MTEPKISARVPAVVTLEPGTYWWCSCGYSNNQPFCDGTHQKINLGPPVKIEITKTERVFLCQCKHSKKKPLCDGSHSKLEN